MHQNRIVGLRLDDGLVAELRRRAEADNRTLSGYVRRVLTKEVQQ